MKKQVKNLLIVVPVCFVLAGLTIFLSFLDSSFISKRLIIAIILSVWAFFIVPSVFYAIHWAKKRINNPDPEQSFRIGYVWGDLIFILLIIIAPVSGLMWFITTISEIAKPKKTDDAANNTEIGTEDIFEI